MKLMIITPDDPHIHQNNIEDKFMREQIRKVVRPIGITLAAPAFGFGIFYVLEVFMDIEVSKMVSSVVNFIVAAFIAAVVYPKILGIPFGRIGRRDFFRRVGFYIPTNFWTQVLLGLVLASCTLSGMLVASLLTGKYQVDMTTINPTQLVFSLNPALWEEFFFRGVLMMVLLKLIPSVKKAFLIQLALFGVMHIKGIDVWALVDVFSVVVIGIGFTYVAYKTRSLVAGIVFHYFHDALLFFVQLPGDVPVSVEENLLFYGLLWLMVGVGCVITSVVVNKMENPKTVELYQLESIKAGS